jgi:uncharacterized NAD(P)/FAD-binding protein YdhS
MGKYLEALKLLYVENEINSELPEARTDNTEQESIPFSDHEIAEYKIDQLTQHDDRVFVRRCLLGVYGSSRLEMVQGYLNQWRLGSSVETNVNKKDNAGRHRANTWLLDHTEVKCR